LRAAALWRSLPAPHRRWIVLNALLATAVINLALNAAIAWLSVRGQTEVPLWARPLSKTSTIGDTLGTLFLLPLVTCVLCTTAVWRELRNGALAPLPGTLPYERWLAGLPPARLRRGIAFGGVVFIALAPPVTAALAVIDLGSLTTGQFVLFKTAFAIALGALVTPVIALGAMTDQLSR
jgi:hypothetical protein